MILHKKQMKLTSVRPLKCYGDSTILSKMKLKETSPDETLDDVLGPLGAQIPETFKRIDELTKYFKGKYKQIGGSNGEQPCKWVSIKLVQGAKYMNLINNLSSVVSLDWELFCRVRRTGELEC